MMYWILLVYLVVAYFIPEVGVIALICMIGPVVMAVRKGRYWCGCRLNLRRMVFRVFLYLQLAR